MDQLFSKLPGALLPWFQKNKRDLPWRKDRDPYKIWISEIMLQQTRVEAVKGYYSRFLEALPTVEDLANAPDEQLHKLWEGLGYYSRVRNLKKAAQVICEKYSGIFPGNHKDVLSLSGIGPYTAGAICSIAFDLPTPAVDGNVLRVVSRITNDDSCVDTPAYKQSVTDKLAAIYPPHAGDFTQALMELGATVCGPNRAPDCGNCPCNAFCLGHKAGTADALPVRAPKAKRTLGKKTVFILRCGDCYALQKRPATGLLAGLWEFPNVPGKLDLQAAISQVEQFGAKPKQIIKTVERKHIFTHIEWDMCGVYMETDLMPDCFRWFTADRIRTQAALPTAFRQFWEDEDRV